MREKGQTEVAKTLETPVFSRGIEILTEKSEFSNYIHTSNYLIAALPPPAQISLYITESLKYLLNTFPDNIFLQHF